MTNEKPNIDEVFASSTTLHGVQHLIINDSTLYKIAWLCLIFTSFAICIWQISERIKVYFSYPTIRVIENSLTESLPFPAVTFCSAIKFNKKLLTPQEEKFIIQYRNVTYIKSRKPFNHKKVNNVLKVKNELFNNSYTYTDFVLKKGFNIKNILRKCTYQADSCSKRDFLLVITDTDICYTFNSDYIDENREMSIQNRENSGLDVLMSLEYDNFLLMDSTVSPRMYFRFHQSREYIFMKTRGFTWSRGTYSFAGLSYRKVITMEPPYGNCTNSSKLEYFASYALFNCIYECEIKLLIQVCNCTSYYILHGPTSKYSLCDQLQASACFENLTTSKSRELDNCQQNCREYCISEDYYVVLSYGQMKNNSITEKEANSIGMDIQYFMDNIVTLSATYDSFSSQLTEMVPAIGISSLMSDIGGQLGLFLGMSLLTMIEVMEYFTRKLWSKIKLIDIRRIRRNHLIASSTDKTNESKSTSHLTKVEKFKE